MNTQEISNFPNIFIFPSIFKSAKFISLCISFEITSTFLSLFRFRKASFIPDGHIKNCPLS